MFPSHRTCVFALRGENKKAKYYNFIKCNIIKITHTWHILSKFSGTFVDSLSNCLVVQLLTVNVRIIGQLYKHRRGDEFSMH